MAALRKYKLQLFIMKKTILFLLLSLLSHGAFAQDITGQWNGILKVPGTQLRLVLNISKTETGYSATMDSPDQGAKGIPVTTTTFENGILKLAIPAGKIEYEGVLSDNAVIVGNFKQMGQVFPLNLSRGVVEKTVLIRPQEPVKPYPYSSEEVTFENSKAGITLAGTLTLPKKEGLFPVVILVSGSGPQNRDEELLGHKPFLVLSDYLTRNGIAVLRYDDRGVGASKGVFSTGTTADFSSDAAAAVTYLSTRKDINQKKIGIVGHSEGGIIAPIVASTSKNVAFIVLLAGTGLQGDVLLLLQKALIERAEGVTEAQIEEGQNINKGAFTLVKKATTTEQLKTDLALYFKQNMKGALDNENLQSQVDQITSNWMQYFIKFDPTTALKKVKCPVLAINGAKDLQVPPAENLTAIKAALTKGGNKKVTTIILPNLNHLFQECTTGAPSEYATIEQTFSPSAMDTVLKWIQLQTK